MAKNLFVTSSYLSRPNVVIGFDYHYHKGRIRIDNVSFSTKHAICEGVCFNSDDVMYAVCRYIRKNCQYCDIYIADEEEFLFYPIDI